MNLKEALVQYKESTIRIIEFAEKEHYDYIENAIENRQKIIDEINLMKYTKEEFKGIALELNLDKLEEKLTHIMAEKKDKVREQLIKTKENNNANKSYNKIYNDRAMFFNKKI